MTVYFQTLYYILRDRDLTYHCDFSDIIPYSTVHRMDVTLSIFRHNVKFNDVKVLVVLMNSQVLLCRTLLCF